MLEKDPYLIAAMEKTQLHLQKTLFLSSFLVAAKLTMTTPDLVQRPSFCSSPT
jgi:hypothetical protein